MSLTSEHCRVRYATFYPICPHISLYKSHFMFDSDISAYIDVDFDVLK